MVKCDLDLSNVHIETKVVNFMAVDIGGATRNGIAIVNSKQELIYSESIPKLNSITIGEHRRRVAARVRELCTTHSVVVVGMERVRSFRGGVQSSIRNIVSLAKETGAIIDNVHDIADVVDYEVVSWKSKVLKNKSADKSFAVDFVKGRYKVDVPHDEADAICSALYLSQQYFRKNILRNLRDM